MKRSLLIAALAALMATAPMMSQGQTLKKTHVTVVGNQSHDPSTVYFEGPFWTKTIPELSKGQVTAKFIPFDEMGLKGPEILDLMSQGVIEFGTATLSYFSGQDPIYNATDIVGTAPTIKIEREVVNAFTPILAKKFESINVKLLGLGSATGQVLFCNTKIAGLADLKGKKIRITGQTQANFVAALGASGVFMGFPDVVPALQTKVIDCAITGSLPGFLAKWNEVSSYLLELPLNWNPILYAVNLKQWNALDPDVRAFIEKNFNKMLDDEWESVNKQTQEGIDCNSGAPACPLKGKGHMTLVKPTQADYDLLKKVAYGTVAKKWAATCSAQCVKDFNATIGKVLGFTVEK